MHQTLFSLFRLVTHCNQAYNETGFKNRQKVLLTLRLLNYNIIIFNYNYFSSNSDSYFYLSSCYFFFYLVLCSFFLIIQISSS